MKKKTMRRLAALMALTLTLSLLAGCGGEKEPEQTAEPFPEQSQEAEPSQSVEESAAPSEPEPSEIPEPSIEPTAAPDPSPDPTAATEPTAAPDPTPSPEPAQTGPEDGIYTANVTLSGGTGRATVQSPATLRCANGQFTATIVWSSSNYDYMKVNGVRYDPVSAAGENSAFEIPVAAFDQPLAIVADTVAMSEPHEIEYTLTFDSASLTKQ